MMKGRTQFTKLGKKTDLPRQRARLLKKKKDDSACGCKNVHAFMILDVIMVVVVSGGGEWWCTRWPQGANKMLGHSKLSGSGCEGEGKGNIWC